MGRFYIKKVDPEELMFALGLGDAAATLKTPVENPELRGYQFPGRGDWKSYAAPSYG